MPPRAPPPGALPRAPPPGAPPHGAPPGAPPGAAPGYPPSARAPPFGAPPSAPPPFRPGPPPLGAGGAPPPPLAAAQPQAYGGPPPAFGAPPPAFSAPPQQPPPPSFGAPPPPSFGAPPAAAGYPPARAGPAYPPPPGGAGAPPPPPAFAQPRPAMMPPPGGAAPPPAFPGGAGPPPPGSPMAPPSAYGGYDAAVEGMSSLSLGSGAGEALDAGALPRPTADAPLAPLPGSCDPAFMRMTCGALPSTSALRQRFGLPLAVLMQPMAETAAGPTPVVNASGAAIIRCRRCRTYINPFCPFTDGGRRWRCNCCSHLNEVPVEYFSSLGADGRRRDVAERPELCCGSVEYIAPAEYMVRPPMPPVYYFVLDCSQAALQCGYLPRACAAIRAALDALPGDDRTQVGLLAFDASLHFYSMRPGAASPRVLVVSDLLDPFIPCPDDLLVNLAECRACFEAALEALPAVAQAGATADACLGTALQASLLALQHLGGKLLLFSATLPSCGEGKLRNRDDARLFGTDREHSLRNPEDGFYKKTAAECSRVQVCVDLFSFAQPYTDLPSLAVLPKYTGGQLYHMPGYSEAADGERLHADIVHNLTRETAWEAVMRVRCSKGFRVSAFHGHFFVRSTDLLALPAADPDKAYAIQLSHEETVAQPGVTYLQCALLHTTSRGERRIRVHTLAVTVTAEMTEMFRAVDGGAMASMVAKLALERSLNGRLEEARSSAVAKATAALKEYRSLHPAAARAYAKLVFPDTLALLPLFTLALGKCAALRGGAKEVGTDERAAAAFDMMAMPPARLLKLLYPTCYALHLWSGAAGSSPPLVPLSGERIDARGWYLLDDARQLLLWAGASAPPEALASLFGCAGAAEAQAVAGAGRLALAPPPHAPGSAAAAAAALVAQLRAASPVWLPLRCAVQGGAGEGRLFSALVEDRSPGQLSYAEHLLQLHRAVQTAPRT